MPRPGYTNVPPSNARDALFETICTHLALDPEQHSARVQAIDYALRITAREIKEMTMSNDRLETYFQHYAEVLADDDEVANVTVVEIRGTDCQYEMVMEDGATYHGWYRDGESVKDIKWENA